MIPKTNNAGGKRKKLGPKAIVKKERFQFSAVVIRRFMSKAEYLNFCFLYDKNRGMRGAYVPSLGERRALAKFESGKLTLKQLQSRLKVKSAHNLFTKIGRIYAATKAK